MKWIPLDGKKEPKFNYELVILMDDGGWLAGCLKSITQDSDGKKYVFINYMDGTEINNATHYMVPEPPKTK